MRVFLTIAPEKKALMGKANSFIRQLIISPLEQTEPSNIFAVHPGSPPLQLYRKMILKKSISKSFLG
jgi:hypothetical protein